MKRPIAVLMILAVVCCVLPSISHSEPPNKEHPSAEVRKLMREKLTCSQKLLEAVVTEDYRSVSDNAKRLARLSTDRDWKVLPNIEYSQHSLEFTRAVDALHTAAEDKNGDAVSLAYVNMTMKCIYCHKYVRKARMARASAESLFR